MELLNNLWIAFSTPNDGLINVILFFGGFVEALLLMNLFLFLTDTSTSKLKKIIFLVFNSIFFALNRSFISDAYYIFINYLVVFISAKYLFKVKTLKALIGIICFYIIFGLIGTFVLSPFLKIFNITFEHTESIPIYRIIYLSLMYSIMYLIIFLFKKNQIHIILPDKLDKKSKSIIVSNFIIGVLALCIQVWIVFNYIDNLPITFSILSFISLLAYFIISIYSLTRVIKLFKTTEALHNVEEYNKTLQILHDNVRCFKHDFDNIVMAIGGYVHTDDIEGLKKYYSHLQEDCQKSNTLYLLNPNTINNPAVYSLLTNKYYKAEENNIKLNFSFLLDFSKLNMNIYEFTRILGILLDNAIEASSESDNKIINVSFRNEYKNNRQIVLIENTYKDSGISMDKIFDKGVSGKDNHTGLGLWEVRKIVKKHNNLNLYTNKNNKYFIQQLEMYY